MDGEIRYCKRPDGASVAYLTMGAGPPLIVPPPWISDIQGLASQPDYALHNLLASHFTVVAYDKHGCGLSDRERDDLSLDDDVTDLETVMEHLGIERAFFFGSSHAGPMVVAYAARHPEKVERIVFWGTFAHGAGIARPEVRDSMLALIRAHWGLASQTLSDIFLPGAPTAVLENFARFQRTAATAEMAARLYEQMYEIDVRDLASRVTAPALVLHRRGERAVRFELGRELASLLPNAELVALEGRSHAPLVGDADAVLDEISSFLGCPPMRTGNPMFAAVLFTDMEDSTSRTQRLGDLAAQQVQRVHDRLLRNVLAKHSGREVKHTGDGIMASFHSPNAAIACGLAMQETLAEHNTSSAEPIKVRIGIAAGETLSEGDDLFGTIVQLASRLCDHAVVGSVLVSDSVRELVAGKGFDFDGERTIEMKGFRDPVRACEVRSTQLTE